MDARDAPAAATVVEPPEGATTGDGHHVAVPLRHRVRGPLVERQHRLLEFLRGRHLVEDLALGDLERDLLVLGQISSWTASLAEGSGTTGRCQVPASEKPPRGCGSAWWSAT